MSATSHAPQAEIMCKQLEPPILMQMTGIELVPAQMQAQAKQMAQANPQQAQQIAAQNPDARQGDHGATGA